MGMRQSGRNMGIYVTTLLCIFANILLTMHGAVSNWPTYTYYVFWIQMAIILYTLFDKRVPIKLQGILYATFTASTVFIAGLYFETYYLEIVFLCGVIVLSIFYETAIIIMYETALCLLTVILHATVCDVVNLSGMGEITAFGAAFFIMLGIGVSGCVVIVRDKMSQEKLKEAAIKAEQAEHAKSDFLANMSHEIRTPMNAIIGMCELTLRESGLSESVREYCSQIQNSGRSLLAIINDILDFSKIESGKMELIEDEFNIASTLNDVVNMTLARMGDKRLEFVVHVDPTIPKALLGDEIRIRQIIINLLTNAVKYTNEGVVNLDVTQTVRSYGINLIISVRDSGIGISKKNLEKLFSSFQQVDTKKNRSVEGTGLGLVISKRLITRMGGFINVSSEYGVGSEFKFVIPLKVKDDMPFIHINEADKVNALFYINLEKFKIDSTRNAYKKFLAQIGDSIQVKHHFCKTYEELVKRLDVGGASHLFIGKEEYLENTDFYTKLASKMEVILVQNRRDGVVVPPNMRCLYKPVYELPIASVFNNENSIVDLMEEKMSSISFIAPKARILIVDDNSVNLQVAVGLMQPYKMQVLTVTSGRDAIRVLGSKDFDLVLMDHMMPELDGVETTQIIRNKPEEYYKTLPIIALTANAVNGAREMYLANGFNGFITKPIELSALDRALKHNLPKEKLEKPIEEEQTTTKREVKVDADAAQFIDVTVGLSYIGNNVDTYMSILKSYVEKGKEKYGFIADLHAQEDWKNYIIEAHALKSSSLSIGAKELSEKAKKLELSGKAGDFDYLKNNHTEMMALYQAVIEKGEKILLANTEQKESEAKAEARTLEEEDLKAYINQVKEAIASFDGDEVAAIAEQTAGCMYQDVEVGAALKHIGELASDFDFDQAEEELKAMCEKCGMEV